jgi:G3E family GTPase
MLLTFGSSANGSVSPWAPDEERKNKLIFIGRNLDRDQLKKDFEACII